MKIDRENRVVPLKLPSYSVKEIEHVSGINSERICDMIDIGLLPLPDIRKGVWLSYSQNLYLKVVKELARPLLNKVAMALHLETEPKEFHKALHCGAIPQPEIVIRKRGYYRNIQKIEAAWKKWKVRPILKPSEQRQAAGYYSLANVAALCDVAPSTLQHHVKKGAILAASHTLKGVQGKYYKRREKNSIVKFVEKRRTEHRFIDAAKAIKGKTR